MTPRWPNVYAFHEIPSTRVEGRWLRPIHVEDAEQIRQWRNSQLEVLRQPGPLSPEDQARYFEAVVRPQFDLEYPDQILLAYLDGDELIGYGGIVHICWPDLRGEVSFLTSLERAQGPDYEKDFGIFLELLKHAAGQGLRLRKLTGETYDIRERHVQVLESSGFVFEGRMHDHVLIQGRYVDGLIHGCFL
jgi:RimJ/RimL family protein N-acetyltransferase